MNVGMGLEGAKAKTAPEALLVHHLLGMSKNLRSVERSFTRGVGGTGGKLR